MPGKDNLQVTNKQSIHQEVPFTNKKTFHKQLKIKLLQILNKTTKVHC